MTEEIKEILDNLYRCKDEDYMKYQPEDILTIEDVWLLLDHITNLQQLYESGLKVNQSSHKYITELEMNNAILKEDLDKANDIIEKNRQFYKCRMDEYAELKKENEELKQTLHNITINGVEEENTSVLDLIKENDDLKNRLENAVADCNLRLQENERLNQNNQSYQEEMARTWKIADDYKSRCEKAIEYINFVINHYKEQLETPIEYTYFDSDVNRKGYILSIIAYLQTILDTLIGSDEK